MWIKIRNGIYEIEGMALKKIDEPSREEELYQLVAYSKGKEIYIDTYRERDKPHEALLAFKRHLEEAGLKVYEYKPV